MNRSPCMHPDGPIVMRQRWESLLFLHWEYSVDAIQSTLPHGLKVDTFKGKAYIGIVPFLMRQVRPRYLFSVPGLSDFLELNLRTYVVDASGQRGVWFYSLDANQALAVIIAQKLFSLPYKYAQMKYSVEEHGWKTFSSKRKGEQFQSFCFRGASKPAPAEAGTLSEFLVERYRLFSYKKKTASLYTGEVNHAPYRISDVELETYSKDLFKLNSLIAPLGEPDHQVLADAVDVDIYPLTRVL